MDITTSEPKKNVDVEMTDSGELSSTSKRKAEALNSPGEPTAVQSAPSAAAGEVNMAAKRQKKNKKTDQMQITAKEKKAQTLAKPRKKDTLANAASAVGGGEGASMSFNHTATELANPTPPSSTTPQRVKRGRKQGAKATGKPKQHEGAGAAKVTAAAISIDNESVPATPALKRPTKISKSRLKNVVPASDLLSAHAENATIDDVADKNAPGRVTSTTANGQAGTVSEIVKESAKKFFKQPISVKGNNGDRPTNAAHLTQVAKNGPLEPVMTILSSNEDHSHFRSASESISSGLSNRKASHKNAPDRTDPKVHQRKIGIFSTPPRRAFRVQMPPKITPWNEVWAAPTETFKNAVTCPIDWSYVRAHTDGLNDAHIRAYELRAPWNPESQQLPFGAVIKAINRLGDTTVNCEEGVRKRFATANLKVYEATGVYFENNVKGLEKDYNLSTRKNKIKTKPISGKDYDYFTDKDNKQEAAATYRFILQPPASICSDRCQECCDEGFCYDGGCREDDCCTVGCCDNPRLCGQCRQYGYRLVSCSDISCGIIKCRCPCEHRINFKSPEHSIEAYQVTLRKKGAPFGCPEHEPIVVRDIVAGMLDKVSSRQFDQTTILRVDPKVFDIFTSCIVLGVQNGVPHRLLRLSHRDPKAPWEEMTYEPVDEEVTIVDLFRAYCCSQVLGCPSVSDIFINQVLIILKQQEAYESAHRAGITQDNNPALNISILDLEPEDINYVFRNTSARDPVRQILLDILYIKKADFQRKIRNHEGLYHPEFLRFWLQRDLQRVESNLLHFSHELEGLLERCDTALANGDDAQTWIDQAGDIESHLALQNAKRKYLEQKIENIRTQEETNLPAAGLVGTLLPVEFDPDGSCEDAIWGECRFEGWRSNEPPISKFIALSNEELQERLSTIPDTFFKDIETFCRMYHNECAKESPCLHKPTIPGHPTNAVKHAIGQPEATGDAVEEEQIAPNRSLNSLDSRPRPRQRETTPLTLAARGNEPEDNVAMRLRERQQIRLMNLFAFERTQIMFSYHS